MDASISYRFGDAELWPDRRLLLVAGAESRIGTRAFDLLLALVERRDRVVEKHELLDLVWHDRIVEENNLHVHVSGLRRVLGAGAIATIPGRGYRFTAPLEAWPAPQAPPRDDVPAAGPAPAARASRPSPPSNLPRQPPPLFGREADLLALGAMADESRLVTLVGPAGVGKTALARALAAARADRHEDGAWLVELASLAEGEWVAPAVARVLGVSTGAGDPVAGLVDALAASRLLLVLDNCEHVPAAVATLAAALLAGAPGVRLLATSQEPLKLAGERVHRLGGLELPSAQNEASGPAALASARTCGAVALFEARARGAEAGFAVGPDNLAAVIEICRRLDGIALALELAAARVPLLGAEGLRTRLDESLRVLAGGSRLAPARHRTLQAALAWSHGLLAPGEQAVFRRLAVFVGGFGVDVAERVVVDEAIDRWALLDHLGALVDKSLVVRVEAGHGGDAGDAGDAGDGGPPRLRLLEVTRDFALERLEAAGEAEALGRRHAEAMLERFELARRDEFARPLQQRLEQHLPDLDNARAALAWFGGPRGDARSHVALAGAMAWLWIDAGLRVEGLARTRAALASITAQTPPALEARLLAAWAVLAHPAIGPAEEAAQERALALYRAGDDRAGLYLALCRRAACVHLYEARWDEAQAELDEAERLLDPAWPPGARARLLIARGWLHQGRGRGDAAAADYEALLRLAGELGDRRMALNALMGLEQIAAANGRHDEAVARGRALLALMRDDPSLRRGALHFVLSNHAMALTLAGELDAALAAAREALPAMRKVGRLSDLLEPCALLALRRGRAADAARITGCAERSFAAANTRRDLVEQRVRSLLVAGLREALPAPELDRLLLEGAALGEDEAISLTWPA